MLHTEHASAGNSQFTSGTIFITGISASGKSTLGKGLCNDLLNDGFRKVELIDGEAFRERLIASGKEYGYSTEDRNAVLRETTRFAVERNNLGYVCIVCTIAHVQTTRERIREKIGNFMEVYLDCPVEICAERDRKGQYSKAFAGLSDNFVGVTEPYQRSDDVELTLDTYRQSVEACSTILLRKTLSFLRNKGGPGETQ
jgi:adenylylsulfate kinase-like enzyme